MEETIFWLWSISRATAIRIFVLLVVVCVVQFFFTCGCSLEAFWFESLKGWTLVRFSFVGLIGKLCVIALSKCNKLKDFLNTKKFLFLV